LKCIYITSPNLDFPWLIHGFGLRTSTYPEDLTTVHQVHSSRVLDAFGRKGEQLGEADAIVSAEPMVAIGIRTADCVPVLLADPETKVVACVHAGWRGTAANIVGATIDAMQSRGCRPEDIRVAIGPSIGSCCYEVGEDVARHFEQWPAGVIGSGTPRLDLPAINEIQAQAGGARQIWKSGECTFCNASRFFSFRREKEQAGRMISFVNRLA
jgi:polyphenol oxidase